ncbi:unnamed protein product [Schistosoma margrebowiei]|uniref:SMAP domain-containing protein n=2 Tax=Schistosoma margrebowiei TaxID=48269 RepID=A0AA84ZF47_9TREM|nr:unnamed protein product [Schistosoma margrebowiei]
MAESSAMLCDYDSSLQSSDDGSVEETRRSSKSPLISQEETKNAATVKEGVQLTVETKKNSSMVVSPPSYIIDGKRRSRSREHSPTRRHRKRSCAPRSDRGSPSERVSSSKHKRSSHHSRHKHSSRKHHHRDSHCSDYKHRYRRKHRRHSSTSSTSSSSDTSPESKPSRRGSHNGRNSTQLLTTSSKDYFTSQPKPENQNTNLIISTTGVTVTTNSPAVSSQNTTTNVPVQRLTAQDILDKIQKHQQEQAKAQALAAAAAAKLPKYYNPTTVNAVKLAEQQQKRKLLWSKKDGENTSSESKTLWTATSLIAGKGDSAAAAKFRKLMGIHDSSEEVVDGSAAHVNETEALRRAEAQAELFRRLEHEYEMSRTITHTQRGAGLGFSSSSHIDYNAYSAMQSEKDKNPNL